MPGAAVLEMDLRHGNPISVNFRRWSNDLRRAVDDDLSVLTDQPTIENDALIDCVLSAHRHGYHHGVAEYNGMPEVQCLAAVDCAGAWQLGAKHCGYQRAAPHAVRDDLMEHIVVGKCLIDMHRINIARHYRKQLDVFLGQRARQAGRVADFDFIEGAVFNRCHRRFKLLSQDVIAGIDIGNIAGDGFGLVAHQKSGIGADIVQRYKPMYGRLLGGPLK